MTGVYWTPARRGSKKWYAALRVNGVLCHLGWYKTQKEAGLVVAAMRPKADEMRRNA